MAEWLVERGVGLVVLAGYMQLLNANFLDRFPQRVINVHPALLPAFTGIGAVEQALAYGVKVFGVTVHFVDEGVDSGPDHPAARARSAGGDRRRRGPRRAPPDRARAAVRGGAADRPRRRADRPCQPTPRADRVLTNRSPPMTQPGEVRIRRAVLSVSDKTGIVEFAKGLSDLGIELVSTGRHRPGARGRRPRGPRDRRLHGLPRDHERARQDAAPEALRRPARPPRRPGPHGRGGGERDRVRRPRVREPLPVRGDGGPPRGRGGRGDREHRHRRARR